MPSSGRGEELLGEEGVAFGAGDDRVVSAAGRRRRRAPRAVPSSRRASSGPSSSTQRRARAPDAVGEPAHAVGRGEFVRAVGREQEDAAVVQVVGEEDDEIERRGVGPVQVLEHEQHRRGGGAVGEQCQRLLEQAQLRARRAPLDLPAAVRADAAPRRTAGTAARCRRDRSSGRAGPRTLRRGRGRELAPRAGSCRCPLPRRPGRSRRGPPAPRPGRVPAPRARAPRPTNASLARASIRPVSRSPRRPGRRS